jgi:adenylate cyclase
MGLCRVLLARGRPGDARRELAAAYGSFTEGFETADLREARRLLESGA